MNVYYAKCVLYAYPHIEAIMGQIDDLVERRALSSRCDYSPCVEIAQKIVDLTRQKDAFIALKIICERILNKFTEEQLDLLDYKYFKQKPREYYAHFDNESRGYFRKQIMVAKKFAESLERRGANDEWFEGNYMTMDFFKEMYKRVIEHEKKSQKNKAKNKKKTSVTSAFENVKRSSLSA